MFSGADRVRIELPPGTRVSLFPFAVCRVKATGLLWPKNWPENGLEMAPDGKVGTSNEASGQVVTVQVSAPKLLMILPRDQLPAVIAALG